MNITKKQAVKKSKKNGVRASEETHLSQTGQKSDREMMEEGAGGGKTGFDEEDG